MKKINKEQKRIKMVALVIVLMIIVSGASVYATSTYLASQITYKDGKNVEQALNDLYNNKKTTSDSEIEITENGKQTLDKYYKNLDINIQSDTTGYISKPVLLWTNPSPESSFGAQTISLDLSTYNYVLVVVRNHTNNDPTPRSSAIVPVGDYSNYVGMGCTSTGIKDVRHAKATTSGVTFGVTYWGGQTENNYCIPYKIYGITGDLEIDI